MAVQKFSVALKCAIFCTSLSHFLDPPLYRYLLLHDHSPKSSTCMTPLNFYKPSFVSLYLLPFQNHAKKTVCTCIILNHKLLIMNNFLMHNYMYTVYAFSPSPYAHRTQKTFYTVFIVTLCVICPSLLHVT